MTRTGPRVAAIIPCHNEETAIATVVDDVRQALPDAEIYVYDNASTDRTAEIAARAGAHVRRESTKGKGNVIRRAFADVDADVYLLIDGDDTYDAAAAKDLVAALLEGPLDHVVGARQQTTGTAYRPGHERGNRMLNRLVALIFGYPVTDMLSGYRAFSRRFVKSFPALSREFEVETELTIHAANLRVPQSEVPAGFKDRAPGSESKLRTYRDGLRILRWILRLARFERPRLFYGVSALSCLALSVVFGLPVVAEFLQTGLVPRLPTAVLASSLFILGMLLAVAGIVLDAVKRTRDETSRLIYLMYPAAGPCR